MFILKDYFRLSIYFSLFGGDGAVEAGVGGLGGIAAVGAVGSTALLGASPFVIIGGLALAGMITAGVIAAIVIPIVIVNQGFIKKNTWNLKFKIKLKYHQKAEQHLHRQQHPPN